jgi:hypothetical protein
LCSLTGRILSNKDTPSSPHNVHHRPAIHEVCISSVNSTTTGPSASQTMATSLKLCLLLTPAASSRPYVLRIITLDSYILSQIFALCQMDVLRLRGICVELNTRSRTSTLASKSPSAIIYLDMFNINSKFVINLLNSTWQPFRPRSDQLPKTTP